MGSAALLSAVSRIEQSGLLVERAVVIDHDYRVDAVTDSGLQLRQVIIEAAVAGEAQNRFIWQRALYSQGRWEGPAEGPGTANESLPWFIELDHGSCPDAGVACIRHDHGVVRQKFGDLLANPFRSHRHRVRI